MRARATVFAAMAGLCVAPRALGQDRDAAVYPSRTVRIIVSAPPAGGPDIVQQLARLGMQPAGGSPADMAAFVAEETRRWGEVIRAANISAN